jgi:hypothetical protein
MSHAHFVREDRTPGTPQESYGVKSTWNTQVWTGPSAEGLQASGLADAVNCHALPHRFEVDILDHLLAERLIAAPAARRHGPSLERVTELWARLGRQDASRCFFKLKTGSSRRASYSFV